ncbi:MAG: pyridoxamine 5'-phosphate oxidase family protein [Clostridiales bacterium]|jgi:nitroimidazol reductase NimA-like FMN-containing flavoprotein (pyridoxamine 5'-phosphate oxidase superfamily)|nr:pyridoxamine 5'-phosphate oxidase family protein [Clostridiales bacterium]
MRRKDREITSLDEIIAILKRNQVGRLGLSLDGKPYVVPLNYGFLHEGGKVSIYFHGAKSGLKLDIIRQNPCACFEVDGSHKLITGDDACEASFEYESVIATGLAKICESSEEKSLGLSQLLLNLGIEPPSKYPDAVLEKTAVFKLEVETITGKKHLA